MTFTTCDSFSAKLQRAIHERNMSQKELSKLLGVSKASVSQYIPGKTQPSPKILGKIKSIFGLDTVETSKKPVRKLTPAQAAKVLGQSPQCIRLSLQQGTCPYGYACKGTDSRWVYHISPKKLSEYIDVDIVKS